MLTIPANSTIDRFVGGLLGLALGDIACAPFDGGSASRFAWKVAGRTLRRKRRFTDETQMALDLADSLIAQGQLDVDDLALRLAAGYRRRRKYEPATAKLLKKIKKGEHWQDAGDGLHPEGFFGNGGAARAPVIGLFYANRLDELEEVARDSARATHAHPLAMEGAVLIATITAVAARGYKVDEIAMLLPDLGNHDAYHRRLEAVHTWLGFGDAPAALHVAKRLGNGAAAPESCVTAIYAALRHADEPFQALREYVIEVGGSVGAIGAMSGAIWGALNGISRLPRDGIEASEASDRLIDTAVRLYRVREGVTAETDEEGAAETPPGDEDARPQTEAVADEGEAIGP